MAFEWVDKVTEEGFQLSCWVFLMHLLPKQILTEENMKSHCVVNDIWTVITRLQDVSVTGTYKGLLFSAFVSPQLKHKPFKSFLFYHYYHENILHVCARVIRKLIYCVTSHTPVSNLIYKRGSIVKLYSSNKLRFPFI